MEGVKGKMKAGTEDNVDLVRKGYKRLMCGILTQAYKDFHGTKNLESQIDALFWLASDDAKLFTASMGLDKDPLVPVCDGPKKYKERTKGKRGRRVIEHSPKGGQR